MQQRKRLAPPRTRMPFMNSTTATPNRVEHQLTDKGYVPVYTTAVVDQPWSSYSATDHEVWATAWAIGMGYDLPGAGIEMYGRPSDAQIEASKACR